MKLMNNIKGKFRNSNNQLFVYDNDNVYTVFFYNNGLPIDSFDIPKEMLKPHVEKKYSRPRVVRARDTRAVRSKFVK